MSSEKVLNLAETAPPPRPLHKRYPKWTSSNAGLSSHHNPNFQKSLNTFLLPSTLKGNCTDKVSVHQKNGMAVALLFPGQLLWKRAASPLRSYYKEQEFSSSRHECITPLQLLFLWIPFPPVSLPHPEAVFKIHYLGSFKLYLTYWFQEMAVSNGHAIQYTTWSLEKGNLLVKWRIQTSKPQFVISREILKNYFMVRVENEIECVKKLCKA